MRGSPYSGPMARGNDTGRLEGAADARVSSREETLSTIEALTLAFLRAVSKGEDPTMSLVTKQQAPTE